MSYSDVIKATTALEAYWPIAGSRADASGHGRDLVDVGAGAVTLAGPSLLAGGNDPQGASAEFGGVTANYVKAGVLPPAPATPGTLVEAWAQLRSENPTASEYRGIIGANPYLLRFGPSAPSTPQFQAYHFDSSGAGWSLGGGGVPGLLTPYHVALRVSDNLDGTFAEELYVNGERVISRALAGTQATWRAQTVFQVGLWSTRPMDGWIQHVAVYSAPLDAARVRQHYRCGIATERAPSWSADRRFTSNGSAPAGADGTIAFGMFGASFDLSDSLADGVVTRDPMMMDRLRATGYFAEALA